MSVVLQNPREGSRPTRRKTGKGGGPLPPGDAEASGNVFGRGAEWAFFEGLDGLRRMQGAVLDTFGLGPIETPTRPSIANPR